MADVRNSTDRIPLAVPFWGDRPYLQGAAIFGEIARNLGELTDIRFTLRKLVGEPIALARSPVADPVGEFFCKSDGEAARLWLQLDALAPAPARVPFDENALTANATERDGAITVEIHPDESLLALIIATAKRLIGPAGGKLIFTSVSLAQIPKAGVLTIDKVSRLGDRLIAVGIASNSTSLGKLTCAELSEAEVADRLRSTSHRISRPPMLDQS